MGSIGNTSWMWAEACARLDEAERRQRQFFDLVLTPTSRAAWEPPVNVIAQGRELHVMVALPGARAEEILVQLTPTGVQIETSVAPPRLVAHANVVRLEIPYGRMRRRIELPAGRYALLERRYADGCLSLRLTGSPR